MYAQPKLIPSMHAFQRKNQKSYTAAFCRFPNLSKYILYVPACC